jgi:hypothetical protein
VELLYGALLLGVIAGVAFGIALALGTSILIARSIERASWKFSSELQVLRGLREAVEPAELTLPALQSYRRPADQSISVREIRGCRFCRSVRRFFARAQRAQTPSALK